MDPDISASRARLGALIRAERVSQGLTQPQLAARAGVCVTSIVHTERGVRSSLATLVPLASALGLRVTLSRSDSDTE